MTVICAKCGKALWEAPGDQRPSVEHLCADCGGQAPSRQVADQDSSGLRESAKLQDRDDPTRKPAREVVVRDEVTRDSGRWSDRKIETDRRNDLYEETVTDQETGAVIHKKTERLSDHKGHGADKRGK